MSEKEIKGEKRTREDDAKGEVTDEVKNEEKETKVQKGGKEKQCDICYNNAEELGKDNSILEKHGCEHCKPNAWSVCEACHESCLSRACPFCQGEYSPIVLHKVPWDLSLEGIKADFNLFGCRKPYLGAFVPSGNAVVIVKNPADISAPGQAVFFIPENYTIDHKCYEGIAKRLEDCFLSLVRSTKDTDMANCVKIVEPAGKVVGEFQEEFHFSNSVWDELVTAQEGPEGETEEIGNTDTCATMPVRAAVLMLMKTVTMTPYASLYISRSRYEMDSNDKSARRFLGYSTADTGTSAGGAEEYEVEEVYAANSGVMDRIGALRYKVWGDALNKDMPMFKDKKWIDDMDYGPDARHWVVNTKEGELVASGRLTCHHKLDDDYRDIKLWREKGIVLKTPVIDFGRMGVLEAHRGKGLGHRLNECKYVRVITCLVQEQLCDSSLPILDPLCVYIIGICIPNYKYLALR